MITQFNGIRTNAQEGRELDVSALRTSAEQGDADAQYKLGVCYEYGEGVSKDMTEAEE